MSVENQKLIKVCKEPSDKNNLYAIINLHALQVATNTLRKNDFKMWCYMVKNQDNYGFELSRKACNKWGIKKDAYDDAVHSLIEKKYLVPIREGSNYYIFYELPEDYKSMTFEDESSSVNEITKYDFLHCKVSEVIKKDNETRVVNWERESKTETLYNVEIPDDILHTQVVGNGFYPKKNNKSQKQKNKARYSLDDV